MLIKHQLQDRMNKLGLSNREGRAIYINYIKLIGITLVLPMTSTVLPLT